MATREGIIAKLDKERARLLERFRGLTAEQLVAACTQSEVDGSEAWTPKDHIAHLAMIERAFQGMIHRTLEGVDNPLKIDLKTGGTKDIMSRVHKGNQDNVDEHKDDDIDTLLADLDDARVETMRLLADLSDEQLATTVPGAPWADGTIGGVLLTNAYHQIQHWSWVEEGLNTMATTE